MLLPSSARSLLSRWRHSVFLRQVTAAASGTALAQAIALAFTPLLTRLYGPEAMGLLGIFNAVVASLAAVAALSYPLAIVLPTAVSDAAALARLSLWIGVAMAAAAATVLALWGPVLLDAVDAGALTPWAWLIPLAMLVAVGTQVMSQWISRLQIFAFGARTAVTVALCANGLKTALGVLQPVAASLILSGLAGTLAGTMLAWRRLTQHGGASQAAPSRWHDLRRVAWQHRDFALLRMPQDSLNAVSQAAPLMWLAATYGAASAGHYSLAVLALGAPVALIGQSVGTVFYPRVTTQVRTGGDVAGDIWRTTRTLALVAVAPFVLLMLVGPLLFAWLFGDAWRQAGEYARWLAPWLFLQLVNKPAVAAIPALRLQGGLLLYEVASTGIKLLALWAGWQLALGDVASIGLFSAAGCVAYLWLIGWVLVRARRRPPGTPHLPS